MRAAEVGLVIGVLAFWGVWGVVLKSAMDRVGLQVLFWSQVVQLPIFLGYLAVIGKLWPLHLGAAGVGAALAAGVLVGVGSIFFYVLLQGRGASTIIPLTAVYPAITAVLGMTLLREAVSGPKLVGVACAVIAAVLLTRSA